MLLCLPALVRIDDVELNLFPMCIWRPYRRDAESLLNSSMSLLETCMHLLKFLAVR